MPLASYQKAVLLSEQHTVGPLPNGVNPEQHIGQSPMSDVDFSYGNAEDLRKAFQLFSEMSGQLSASYSLLENQVSTLTQELNRVSEKRLQELAEKERLANRLENLLSVLPGGVVVIDASGYVTDSNPAAVELLGEPLDGMLWRDVIVRSFAPRSDDGHEVSTRDGRRISIATRSIELEGSSDGQIILLTDQTETRRLQAELSRHERLSALGKMVSALAHQIRTPLSAAMLYAGHLCGGKLRPDQQKKFADKVLKRLNHMERQVQDMLLFVKGDIPLSDHVSVNELQIALAEEMEVVLLSTDSECEWQNQCPTHSLRCNQDILVGALLNLVNNAVQAVDRRAQLSINFLLSTDGRQLMIEIIDKGPGIKADILASVTELFMTTKAQGTGLGLAVVQAVARAHGGSFTLDSIEGQGVRAQLLLPLSGSVHDDVFRRTDAVTILHSL